MVVIMSILCGIIGAGLGNAFGLVMGFNYVTRCILGGFYSSILFWLIEILRG